MAVDEKIMTSFFFEDYIFKLMMASLTYLLPDDPKYLWICGNGIYKNQ